MMWYNFISDRSIQNSESEKNACVFSRTDYTVPVLFITKIFITFGKSSVVRTDGQTKVGYLLHICNWKMEKPSDFPEWPLQEKHFLHLTCF
jgi:hypothetical protein